MREGLQMVLREDRRVQKRIGGPGVDQSGERDGRPAGNQELDEKDQVTGGGEREWGGRKESAAQPGPYWLGESCFGRGEGG